MLRLRRREDISQELRSPGCGGLLIGNASIGRIDYYDRISFSGPVLKHVVGRISSIFDTVRCPDRVADPVPLHVRLAVNQTRRIPTGRSGGLSNRRPRRRRVTPTFF